MIRSADDLVQSILADSRLSRPEQAIKKADDLVVVVLDEFTQTREPQPTLSKASLKNPKHEAPFMPRVGNHVVATAGGKMLPPLKKRPLD